MTTITKSNITPFLWFDGNAEEAVSFYTSVFPQGRIDKISRYGEGGPPGSVPGRAMVIEFHLDGQDLMAINGGPTGAEPLATPAPGSIALFVTCDTQAKVDALWDALLDGGRAMMCGWLADKYGVVWNIVPEGLVDYIRGDDEEGAQRAMQAMLGMVKLDLPAIRDAYDSVSAK